MNDNPLAAIQPDAGGQATPPAEPVAPIAPEPPTPPAAPVDPTGADGKLTPDEQDDVDGWDSAINEVFPGLRSANDNKDGNKNEQAKPDQGAEKNGTSQNDAANQKPNAQQENGTGTQPPKSDGKTADTDADAGTTDDDQENEPPEPTDIASRLSAREQQEAVKELKNEIRQKMFADQPTELRAKDGQLLDSIDTLMQYTNPRTGQPFTEEEAGMYLLQANQQLKDNMSRMEAQVEEIASTNLALKDEADLINYQYGALLEAMPELRQQLWDAYSKTFQTDSKSGIITKAPVSLQKFYATALEPYAELGRRLEAEETAKNANNTQTPPAPTAPAQQQQEAQRKQQVRQDRSDIYGGGKIDTQTEDDKEWGVALENVFGDQLKGLRR